MNRKSKIKEELAEAAQHLSRLGYLIADGGLLSVRVGQEVFFSPRGVHRARLEPRRLVAVHLSGKGKQEIPQDSEAWTHLIIYHEKDEVGAVINAQPPTATGFSVSGESLEPRILPETLVGLGGVPLIRRDPRPRGTAESGSVLKQLGEAKAVLIANHGVLTIGSDIWDAVTRQELVEHCAKIHFAARALGKVEALPDAQIARLVQVHFEAEGGRNL